jgi:hypothetical protein
LGSLTFLHQRWPTPTWKMAWARDADLDEHRLLWDRLWHWLIPLSAQFLHRSFATPSSTVLNFLTFRFTSFSWILT